MKKIQHLLLILIFISLCGFEWPSFYSQPNLEKMGSAAWLSRETQMIKSHVSNINDKALRLSLIAYEHIRQRGYDRKQVLTVIDYSKPSTEKRLWVFDLKNGKTLFNTWVSHGKNSGGIHATSFSNQNGSLKSSLGVFVTDHVPYIGSNGYSLRLRGLEPGVNDNAYSRHVVIHGAGYVNSDIIREYGQVGRSWGCPAVNRALARPLIDTIKDKTLVFVYYPDKKWLSHSQFLAA